MTLRHRCAVGTSPRTGGISGPGGVCGGRAHGTIFPPDDNEKRQGARPSSTQSKGQSPNAKTTPSISQVVRLFFFARERGSSLATRSMPKPSQASPPPDGVSHVAVAVALARAGVRVRRRPSVCPIYYDHQPTTRSNAVCLLELTTGPFRYAYSASSRPIDQSVDRFIVWYACAVLSLFAASFSLPPCALVSVHHRNTFFHGVYI